MEKIVTKINCPHCGAPIANTQRTGMIKCLYCNQTFQRNKLSESKEDIQFQYIPPSLSDEDCKLLVIRDLVFTDYVPVDIFDTLEIEIQSKKLYPFYVYHLNWSANWSAMCSMQESYEVPKYDSQGKPNGTKTEYRTHYRDYNGTSAGNVLVVVYGGPKENEQTYINNLCDYYNTHDISNLFLTNEKDYESVPADWNNIEAQTANDVYHKQETTIEKFLENDVKNVAGRDAIHMASGWHLENLHFTYNYRQTKNPECVFRPIWEMKCKYRNNQFDAVTDISKETLVFDAPQNKIEKEKIKTEQTTVEDNRFSRNASFVIAGLAGIVFIILFVYTSAALSSFILLAVGILVAIMGIVFNNQVVASEANIKSTLAKSRQKRKEGALKRYGSDPQLVEMLEVVQTNQDKE